MKASCVTQRGVVVLGAAAIFLLGGCTNKQLGTWFPDEAAQREAMDLKAQPASAPLVATIAPATRPAEPTADVVDFGFPASGRRPVGLIDLGGGGNNGYNGGYGGGDYGGYGGYGGDDSGYGR